MVLFVGEGGGFAGGADGDDAVGAVPGLEFDLLFEGDGVKGRFARAAVGAEGGGQGLCNEPRNMIRFPDEKTDPLL